MAAQAELFPEPSTEIRLNANRGEPRLWVRRLAIWEKPGALIRDVELRRGLNILWSPDPGRNVAELGRDAGIGHGAGKTLFCRFVRYCLGEETFADEDVRKTIVGALPEGYVGIELLIAGKPWAVLRPFMPMRKHIAREGATLEELIESREPGTGVQPILAALNNLFPAKIETNIPGHREWKLWLFALAWLSRDQESRLKGILDWRDRDAQSNSPAMGASQEDLTVVVRSFLNLVETEELEVRLKRDKLAEAKQSLERDLTYLRRRVEQYRVLIATQLGLIPESLQPGELGAGVLEAAAIESVQRQEQDAGSQATWGNDLAGLRESLETILRQRAILEDEIARSQGMLDLHQERAKLLRGERANLSAADIKAKLGEMCSVCGVPIDRALAEGCGLSHMLIEPGKVASQLSDVAAQIATCNAAVESWQHQRSEQENRLGILRTGEADLREQINATDTKVRASEREHRRRWFDAQSRVEKAAELRAMYDEMAGLQENLANSASLDEALASQEQALRRRHEDTLTRFAELFSYVCRGLLGNATRSSLALTGRGFRTDVAVGGTAMGSLKAVAFDLAALLESIEGNSSLPSFLIHDSPREGDLGESIYQRLFRFMHGLEQLSAEAPFQYIVTTTSEPPADLQHAPQLVLKLHGSDIEDRLLRRDLH